MLLLSLLLAILAVQAIAAIVGIKAPTLRPPQFAQALEDGSGTDVADAVRQSTEVSATIEELSDYLPFALAAGQFRYQADLESVVDFDGRSAFLPMQTPPPRA